MLEHTIASGHGEASAIPLLLAEIAAEQGRTADALGMLKKIAAQRLMLRPAERTIDALYPHAWLSARLGDTTAALAAIVPTLNAFRSVPAPTMENAANAGALVQAMTLRAILASAQKRTIEARLWARAVSALTDTSLADTRKIRRAALQLAR